MPERRFETLQPPHAANSRQATPACPPRPDPSDQSTGAQLHTSVATTGLGQQTDQIAASRDLFLLVMPNRIACAMLMIAGVRYNSRPIARSLWFYCIRLALVTRF